jgi:hypothetical protein
VAQKGGAGEGGRKLKSGDGVRVRGEIIVRLSEESCVRRVVGWPSARRLGGVGGEEERDSRGSLK